MNRRLPALYAPLVLFAFRAGASFDRAPDLKAALTPPAAVSTPAGPRHPATGVLHAGHPSRSDLPDHTVPYLEWAFDHANGKLVADTSGHGFDAQICGSARLAQDWGGHKALTLDGSGDNTFWQGQPQNCGLSIAKPLARPFDALTVEAWVRKDAGGWMPVIYRGTWDHESGFGLYMEWSAGKAMFGHYCSGENTSSVQSASVVQDGKWHQVVGVMEPQGNGTHRYRIFVDGRLDAQQTGPWGVTQAPAEESKLMIACPNSSGAEAPFKGELGRIALFDVALTPEMVKERFDAQKSPAVAH